MSRKKTRRSGCRRNRRMLYGGAGGFAYTLGDHVAGAPIINNYGQTIQRFPSCEQAERPGTLSSVPSRGLPGFKGGRRFRRTMKGGRGYTTTFEVNSKGIAYPIQQILPCVTPRQNPFNTPYDTLTAQPARAPFPQPGEGLKGGKRRLVGGVGGLDSAFYEAPRAGYTNVPSDMAGGESGTLADGKTPFMVIKGYADQPGPSPACVKTGGRRRKGKGKRKSKKAKRRS